MRGTTMPLSSPRKLLSRLPLIALLGLLPIGAFSAPGCGSSAAVCGNARVEESDDPALDEECDDGNLTDDDECTNACKLPACGDGIVQAARGEECENTDGAAADPKVDTDGCTSACKLDICGDGVMFDGVEECDDGNLSNTDDCLVTCLKATCGDSFVHLTTTTSGDDQVALEECDDANDDSTDNCTTACKKPACGDGFVWTGFEQCDDGNASNTDACPASCLLPTCGDGFVDPATEECDDGNLITTDGCLPTCKDATCGDGIVEEGVEECDDGNLIAGDFCGPTCKKECFGESSGFFEGRCYMYFPGPLPWGQANCNAFKSHLVTIESAAENTYVKELVPADQTDAWIGLTDQTVESAWFWQLDQQGENLLFPAILKWAATQPDNLPAPAANCAIISQASGLWYDQACTEARGFVCEHEF